MAGRRSSKRSLLVTGELSRRIFCLGAATSFCVPAKARDPVGFHAMVGAGGTHRSLKAALAEAPAGGAPFRILLGRGRWTEKLVVTRPNVELVGEDRQGSILTSSVAAGHERPEGGAWGTFGSATLTIEAPGFTARNLTIENGFDYRANLRSRAVANAQAVALALGNAADRTRIEQVDLIGHQDTFYLRAARTLVRRCLIAGNVDFIFGGAAALFERCEIRTRLRPGEALQGYIAAPSTPRHQPVGLVFSDCRLSRESGVPDRSTYLGRPWRAGGNVHLLGAATYLGCWMDSHIHPQGWTWMNYRGPADYMMRLEAGDARLFEFASRGPGALRHPERPQLSRSEAARFSRTAILGDWKPQ
jgi:pectinesterase